MPTRYTVSQGECLNSVALKHGWLVSTLWNHADNAELKKLRGDLGVLYPGDVVVIPDARPKAVDKPTDGRHVFRRKGVPRKLTVRLLNLDTPAANLAYTITVDGVASGGTTDGDGAIVRFISPAAKSAHIRFEDGEEYELELGAMDPVDEVSGAQKRLANLGLYAGEPDGQLGDDTLAALKRFQAENALEVTGALDEPTQSKLKEVAGT